MDVNQPHSFNDVPTQAEGAIAQTADNVAATRLGVTALGAPPSKGQRGHYVILKEHASGGLGTVSIALDARLNRQVALKEIRSDRFNRAYLRQRFITEAEITSLLEHPGIVPIYAFDLDEEGRPYYAMRFVQGRTLSEAISAFHGGGKKSDDTCSTSPWPANGRVPAPTDPVPKQDQVATRDEKGVPSPSYASLAFRHLLQRFVAVCNTVAFAHSKGVIHRDLKPSNVMIGEYGETLVLDWGLAKRVGAPDGVESAPADPEVNLEPADVLTRVGQVLGTAPYMSPEQARGAAVGAATDTYALGAILYELLTGFMPYHGRSSTAVLEQLEVGPPPPPALVRSTVPRSLEAICLKAMARGPGDRYATVTELARDVEQWLADEPVAAYRETWLERCGRWTRKHRAVLIGAVLAVVAIILALLVGLLVVATLNRNLELTNKELADALDREAAERQLAAGLNRNLERTNKELGEALGREAAERQHARNSETAERSARGEADHRRKEAQEALADTQAFSDFLVQDVLAVARPEKERGGLGMNVTVRQALDEAVKNLATRFAGRPQAEALARHDLGVTYRLIGEFAKAEQELNQALQLRRAHLGADHEDTLRSQNSLAVALGARGKFAESLPLYEDAYQRRLAKLGEAHRDTLLSLNNVASTYQALGRTHEALPLLEKVLQLRRETLEPTHPDVLTSMNNLARVYQALGRGAAAVPLYEETLRLRQELLGPDHPDTVASVDYLAVAYRSAGRLHEALSLFEQAHQQRQAKLGNDHPNTLTTRSGLATTLLMLGRSTEALTMLEETLKTRTAKLGPTHLDTITSMSNLANGYRDTNRVNEALALYERVFKLYGSQLGQEHPFTLTAMHNLGHAYHAEGRHTEALPMLEEALRLRRAKLEPDHPSTFSTMHQLAVAYASAGRNADALALGKEALRGRLAKLGQDHPDTLNSLRNVAAVYLARNEFAEAEHYLLECQAVVERNQAGLPRHLREDTLPSLIGLYEAWGKAQEAERWRQKLPPPARLREGLERHSVWPLFWGWPRF